MIPAGAGLGVSMGKVRQKLVKLLQCRLALRRIMQFHHANVLYQAWNLLETAAFPPAVNEMFVERTRVR